MKKINLFALALLFVGAVACNNVEENDSMEDDMEQMEENAEELGDDMEDAADEVGDEMEEAGNEMEDEMDDELTEEPAH